MNRVTCFGCGGTLQNSYPDAPFYVPKPIDSDAPQLCRRCYRLRHYGDVQPAALTAESYHDMIDGLLEKEALMVLVVDVFDLAGSFVPMIRRLLLEKDVVVLANKCDLIPKSVPLRKMAHKVMRQLHAEGIKPRDVIPVSAIKKVQIDLAIDTLFERAKGRDVYVLGATNVGKSTLINAFIAASSGKAERPLSVHGSRGTTQGFIALPFGAATLYDTPGLYPTNHMAECLTETSYALLQAKKEIKPLSYQLTEGQTLFLGGLCRLDHLAGQAGSWIVYVAPTVPIHRRKTHDAEAFYTRHLGGLLHPPTPEETSFDLKRHRFNLDPRVKTDLVIPGLGFVTVRGVSKLDVYTPRNVAPTLREALI